MEAHGALSWRVGFVEDSSIFGEPLIPFAPAVLRDFSALGRGEGGDEEEGIEAGGIEASREEEMRGATSSDVSTHAGDVEAHGAPRSRVGFVEDSSAFEEPLIAFAALRHFSPPCGEKEEDAPTAVSMRLAEWRRSWDALLRLRSSLVVVDETLVRSTSAAASAFKARNAMWVSIARFATARRSTFLSIQWTSAMSVMLRSLAIAAKGLLLARNVSRM